MSQMPAPPPPNAPAPAFDPGQLPPPPPPGAAAPPAPFAPALTLVPAAPPAPAAPAPATPAPATPAPATPVHVLLPSDPVAALDMGVPLGHVTTAPDVGPSVVSEPRVLQDERPAADPATDPAPDPAPAPAQAPAPEAADASGQWWSPANALVLAVAALTWQFISFYAREQLPGVKASGAELRGFDRLVETLPLAGASPGRLVGVLLAAAALALVLHGTRRGLREPVVQGIVAVVAALSLALIPALPALVG